MRNQMRFALTILGIIGLSGLYFVFNPAQTTAPTTPVVSISVQANCAGSEVVNVSIEADVKSNKNFFVVAQWMGDVKEGQERPYYVIAGPTKELGLLPMVATWPPGKYNVLAIEAEDEKDLTDGKTIGISGTFVVGCQPTPTPAFEGG